MEQHYVLDLKKKYTEEFGNSAAAHLELGMDLFHKYRDGEIASCAPVINSLGIGVELLLKSYICFKNLGLIFMEIPIEIRTLFTCPESVGEFFRWRQYNLGLHPGNVATIGLKECVACFYMFFPQHKQHLLPHFSNFMKFTGTGTHNVFPSFSSYDFERFGFTTLQVVAAIPTDVNYPYTWYTLSDRDKKFMDGFDKMRIERVQGLIEYSREHSKEIEYFESDFIHSDWNTFRTICPVCKSNGTLEGFTEMAVGEDEEGKFTTLDFFAASFYCSDCGLKLDDVEELKLAGMNTLYDRSHELDEWFRGYKGFSDWYLE